jgi:hypothetical protein
MKTTLALLALCAAPLLAQAQADNCAGGVNANDQYILGEADGKPSAMHWHSGLVWQRCLARQGWDGSSCVGSGLSQRWNDWMVDYMPNSGFTSADWWQSTGAFSMPARPYSPPDRIMTGAWRMAYVQELQGITTDCSGGPKLNQAVFPNAPSSGGWSGSPRAGDPYSAWAVSLDDGAATHTSRAGLYHVQLVRGGQPFAPLMDPVPKTAVAGDSATFQIILKAKDDAGQAWGGLRIEGGTFWVDGRGWVTDGIVRSGQPTITVRVQAPATAGDSATAALTLRSALAGGTAADGSNGGSETTTREESIARFTVTATAGPGHCTGDNADDQYILGDADGKPSAMHWHSGLVWQRCLEGQGWDGSTCTGDGFKNLWNDWMVEYMPNSGFTDARWWQDMDVGGVFYVPERPDNPPDRIVTGAWRMPYAQELEGITTGCGNAPKLNRAVFPNVPPSLLVWSGSPFSNYSKSALLVGFVSGFAYDGYRYRGLHIRLVRAGQSFAPLAAPSPMPTAAGAYATFPLTLAPKDGAGQAWGGLRIAGGEFQVDGGSWVTDAIVRSGQSLNVRVQAPATAGASATATLTLRSALASGTVADGSNGGSETTTREESIARFTAHAMAPMAGSCGSASASGTLTVAEPSGGLCGTGTASAVNGGTATWGWSCAGQYGGADTSCQAPRGYPVTATAGAGGSIGAGQTVAYNGTAAIAVTPAANHAVDAVNSSCGGSLAGNTFTAGPVTGTCTVHATFKALPPPPDPVPGQCGGAHAGTALLGSAPSGASLCGAGTASGVNGGPATWSWSCAGQYGGAAAQCSAPRGYPVTATAGAGGGISPGGTHTVAYHATPAFTVTPAANHAVDAVTGCGGSLADDAYTTAPVTQACTVSATFAPITHAVTATASPAAGGSATCPGSVRQGANAACTAVASAGYQFHSWTGACAGQGAACSLDDVQASHASQALFTQHVGLSLPEGPQGGQPLALALQPGNGWQVTQAGTHSVASLGAPALPAGVTLPHGVVRLALRHGAQGSAAQVVLRYPQALPAGAVYYKYGPTQDNPQAHWHPFGGAHIAGDTITLVLADGGAGDGDLRENGAIDDPGGPALVAAPAHAIPALGAGGMGLLALLAGIVGLRRLQAKNGAST